MLNDLFIVVQNPFLSFDLKEFSITIKQSTNLLIKCKHNFKLFVAELLVVRDNTIKLRNLVTEVFNPRKTNQALIGEESSQMNNSLMADTAKQNFLNQISSFSLMKPKPSQKSIKN